MKMKTFEELVDLIEQSSVPLYIRWSRVAPTRDIRLRASRNHATGRPEAGLSVERISPPTDWPYPLRAYVAQQLMSYAGLGGRPYLLTGEEVGRGADGEPLLGDRRLVATIAEAVIVEARRLDPKTGEICRHEGRIARYTTGVYCERCDQRIATRPG